MRIARFTLDAFGPFTDTSLVFEPQPLHLIYGPNEAGKSSTLRALTAWLYGFPERTADNFLHANPRLCVSGTLENGRGEIFTFSRRKKRKGSVLDAHGNAVDPQVVAAWLQGLDQETFQALFGLDHPGLVEGGSTILQEQGSTGTTLFAAGSGIASLKQIQNDLQEEYKALFKPGGSRPELNAALQRYSELKKECNQLALSSTAWKHKERALREAEKVLESLKEQRRIQQAERRRLERIHKALPPLARLRRAESGLTELGLVPDLPDDFPKRRQEGQDQLREAQQTLDNAEKRLTIHQQKLEAISLNTELLDQAANIADLHQRLGAYRKGQADLRSLEDEEREQRAAARDLLRGQRPDLDPADSDTVQALLAYRSRVQTLGERKSLVDKELEDSRTLWQTKQGELGQIRDAFQALPAAQDTTLLHQAAAQAGRLGDIDAEIGKKRNECERKNQECATMFARLGRWHGTPEDVLALPLPLEETVQTLKQEWEDAKRRTKELEAQRHELTQTLADLHEQLQAQQEAGAVPSEEDLDAKRLERDTAWSLLRRQWVDGEDVSGSTSEITPEGNLIEHFEHTLQEVDTIADRLRRESDRVHTHARLAAQYDKTRQQRVALEEAERQAAATWEDLQARWHKAWSDTGIEPDDPRTMLGWLQRFQKVVDQARSLQEDRFELKELEGRRHAARHALARELQALEEAVPRGEDMTPVRERADTVLEAQDRLARKQQQLQDERTRLERESAAARQRLTAAEEAKAAWQENWGLAMQELGLPGDATPEAVRSFFSDLDAYLSRVNQADGLRQRIEGIRCDSRELERDVASLVARTVPDLAAIPVDQAIERLNGLLQRERDRATTADHYRERIAYTQEEIEAARIARDAANRELAALCELAGCTASEELAGIEKRWQEHKALEQDMTTALNELREIPGVTDVDALIAEVKAENTDELPARLQSCDEELERLEGDIEGQIAQAGELRREFREMDGRDAAARKAEEAQATLASIRRLAERYARLRLASTVLDEAIERYRAENQDPVLALGSGYFRELTIGSFDGLLTDLDDKGGQVIVGLRGEERVPVGGMSSGTRDQLYLALHLASLEHRLKSSEPMPFIVDDILVNFDEERTRAALQAMARLGEKNQVLLFSHHRQVADAVRELDLGEVHGLGGS
ncbi:MAG: AAA family ATPase [Desulfovermiculus sp.]